MTKKLNKAAKATLAAALVASAIVPVASASANTTASISNVVVVKDGVQYDLTKPQFDAAVGLGLVSATSISHIKVDGKYYTKALLNAYIGTGKTVADSLMALTTSDKEEAITPTPATFKDGQIVPTETPATELKVESVSAINANQILVTFNQKVEKRSAEELGNYLLEGKVLNNGVSTTVSNTLSTTGTFGQTPKATLQADGKSVLITLDTATNATTQLLEGQVKQKLTVDNVKETTGKTVAKTAKEFTLVDTTIPTVESVKTEGNRVIVVKFSEYVSTATATNAINYQIDGVSLTAYGAGTGDYNEETNEVRFTLSSALADKTYAFKYSVDNAIQDAAQFKVVEGTTNLTITADKTPAKVSSVEVVKPSNGANYILVKFTKPLAQTSNFVTGTPVQLDGASLGSGSLSVENGALKIVSGTANGAHAINITNDATNYLEDAYGVKVEAGAITYNVEADVVKPTVTSTKVLDGNIQVEVKFSERVESASATNRLNYTIKNEKGEEQTVTRAAYKTGTTDTVVLTLNSALKAGTFSLDVKNVKDEANPANTMDAYNGSLTVVDTVKPTVSSVTYTGTTVYVTFSEDMNTSTITNAASYLFDNKELPKDAKITAISNTVAKVEFATGTIVNGKKFAVSTDAKDVAGNPLSGFGYETTIGTLFDTKDLDVDTNGGVQINATGQKTVTVKLTKALEVLNAAEFEYTIDNGANWNSFTQQDASFTTTNGKSTITFTLPVTDAQVLNNTNVGNVKIRTKVLGNAVSTTKATDGSTLASDKNGVLFNAGSAVALAPTDKVAPAVEITNNNTNPKGYNVAANDITKNGKIDQLVITFSETLKGGSVSTDDFAVSGLEVSNVTTAGSVVTLTLKEGSISDTADTFTVTLKGDIEDSAGNVLKADTSKVYKAVTDGEAALEARLPATVSIPTAAKVTINTADNLGANTAGTFTLALPDGKSGTDSAATFTADLTTGLATQLLAAGVTSVAGTTVTSDATLKAALDARVGTPANLAAAITALVGDGTISVVVNGKTVTYTITQ